MLLDPSTAFGLMWTRAAAHSMSSVRRSESFCCVHVMLSTHQTDPTEAFSQSFEARSFAFSSNHHQASSLADCCMSCNHDNDDDDEVAATLHFLDTFVIVGAYLSSLYCLTRHIEEPQDYNEAQSEIWINLVHGCSSSFEWSTTR